MCGVAAWCLFSRCSFGSFVLRCVSCPSPAPLHVTGGGCLQTAFQRFPSRLASSWVWLTATTNKSWAGERKGELELFLRSLSVILALFLAKTASYPCWISPFFLPISCYFCPIKVANLLDSRKRAMATHCFPYFLSSLLFGISSPPSSLWLVFYTKILLFTWNGSYILDIVSSKTKWKIPPNLRVMKPIKLRRSTLTCLTLGKNISWDLYKYIHKYICVYYIYTFADMVKWEWLKRYQEPWIFRAGWWQGGHEECSVYGVQGEG